VQTDNRGRMLHHHVLMLSRQT